MPLRTLVLVCALGSPGAAPAEQFPQSAVNAPVRGHDGATVGRVTAVERNADGEIVAVEIPGLEPPDAPAPEAVASENRRAPDVVPVRAPPPQDAARRRSGA